MLLFVTVSNFYYHTESRYGDLSFNDIAVSVRKEKYFNMRAIGDLDQRNKACAKS